MLTKKQVESIEALLMQDKSIREVSRRVGVSRESVRRVKNGNRSYQTDRSRSVDGLTQLEQMLIAADLRDLPDPPGVYLPPAEEIRAWCQRFRRRRPRRPVGCRGAAVVSFEGGLPC